MATLRSRESIGDNAGDTNDSSPSSTPTTSTVTVPGSPIPTAGAVAKDMQQSQQIGGCISLKLFSLVCLVFQNCGSVLLMRYTMTQTGRKSYSVASVVITQEGVKFVLCIGALIKTKIEENPSNGIIASMRGDLMKDALKLSVPAGCYTLQNNLLFMALANLEATLFQVTYQLKLLVTALFMVLMLGKSLSYLKWLSLFILFSGIVMTQVNPEAAKKKGTKIPGKEQDIFTGLVAVVVCSVSSAFASVYFEKVLKSSGPGPAPSLPVRNIQLSFFSSFFALWVFWYLEKRSLVDFFNGYDGFVWTLVMFQAAGGLLVALVIKYADNILKGFATAIAIVLSGVLSFLFIDFEPSLLFIGGASCVICAVCLYAYVP